MLYTVPYYYLMPFFLCWGSFLNVLAYRLIIGKSIIKPRSFCPRCKYAIAWYDNIPLISWILLQTRCRNCKQPISFFYPFIESITTIIFVLLYTQLPHHYFFSYVIFFSALIVTIRSDLETMLISRYTTIYLAPLAFIMSLCGLLPISWKESICGAIFGYSFLFIINSIFKYWRNVNGIGEGDFDLLLFIGSFTGVIGCWFSLTIGSILGSLYGIYCIISAQQNKTFLSMQTTKIPFGPFLALGAIIFVFMHHSPFFSRYFNFFLA